MHRLKKWRKHRRCHAKVRAAERYQMRLTNQDLTNIVGMIQNQKFIASHRVSCSKSAKLIEYQERRLVVLYSHRHQEIITVLPETHKYARILSQEAAACA